MNTTSAEIIPCQYANVEGMAVYQLKNREPNLLARIQKMLIPLQV